MAMLFVGLSDALGDAEAPGASADAKRTRTSRSP
jgi:hypothetical protein